VEDVGNGRNCGTIGDVWYGRNVRNVWDCGTIRNVWNRGTIRNVWYGGAIGRVWYGSAVGNGESGRNRGTVGICATVFDDG